MGARNSSINGNMFAKKIAKELGNSNFIITSGMARGIDSYAHAGSINTGTIGVLAGGVNNIYPLENKKLYDKMKEQGVLIAESPFDKTPKANNFPQRNRIIAGMSMGCLVVEASLGSGSLITAKYAAEENRDVFAVPGFPLDARSKGCNNLLKQGAILVENADDIYFVVMEALQKYKNALSDQVENFEYQMKLLPDEDSIKKAREDIVSLVNSVALSVEDIISMTKIPYRTIQIVLLELELAGRLQKHIGNKFSLIFK